MSELNRGKLNVLFLGAAYGSLPAIKMLMAGHDVRFICRPEEAELINAEGFRVRIPITGHKEIELDSRKLPGRVRAQTPADEISISYDLAVLAMQEPQYSDPYVGKILQSIAMTGLPVISIMNMPPPPYLSRIPSLKLEDLAPAFTSMDVWQHFKPERMTLCSPDPQAIRPQGEDPNVLQVTLATNFKSARFGSPAADRLLNQLQYDFEIAKFEMGNRDLPIPVKFKVYDSVFVPFAKWPMLLAGNYRCVTKNATRTIAEAVNANIAEAKSVYEFVQSICLRIGARLDDLVPFEKYVAASLSLVRPSSSARALDAGARSIERPDKLVQLIGWSFGMSHPIVEDIVNLVDQRLTENRTARHL